MTFGPVTTSCILSIAMLIAMPLDSTSADADTLQFIAIVHRHGDRNPITTYANDPYKNMKWSGGLGSLSSAGTLQMFTLGRNLRERYGQLLPQDGWYSKDNMHVVSSAKERSIASAECLLASFMPPPIEMNPLDIPWQPIAINAIPADKDNILFQILSACPKYDRIYRELLYSTDSDSGIRKFNEKHAEVLNYIAKHSGQNITDFMQSIVVYDVLQVQKFHNLTLPTWTESVFPDVMARMKERAIELFTETPYMRRIKGGLLVTEIFNKMVQKRSREISQNILIYSGHDNTLANMARGLNITDQVPLMPEYGAAVIFEMHCKDANSTGYAACSIEMWYYANNNEKSPRQLIIPNCGLSCSLEDFRNSIKDISIHMSEYDEACKLN